MLILLPFNRRQRQAPRWIKTDIPTAVPAGSNITPREVITPRDDPYKDHPMHCKCQWHR